MTDFYALLKQSIIDRGLAGESERQEMYAQARRAVIKQLWDYRPPLAADEIDMRVGAYDTAVERIEADLQSAIARGKVLPRRKLATAPATPAQVPQPSQRSGTGAAPARASTRLPGNSVGRATVSRGGAALATARQLPAPQDYAEAEEEEDRLDSAYVEETAAADEATQYQRSVRWARRGKFEQDVKAAGAVIAWPAWLGTGEQAPVRIAAIVAGALFILLVAVISYELGARSSRSVTLPIGVRHEVSDAATAARIPNDAVKVAQTFSIFDGTDPTVFATTPDNPIAFDNTGGVARVSSSTSAPGVKVTIGAGVAGRLAGHNVRVVIVARSSQESGAATMRFAYQSGLAVSHWQTASLGADYAAVGIEWRVPAMRTSPDSDYLLIEPGIPGDGTGVDVKSVRIDVLSP